MYMKKGTHQTILVRYLDDKIFMTNDQKASVQFTGFSDQKPGLLQSWQMSCKTREEANEKLAELLKVWNEKKALIILYL